MEIKYPVYCVWCKPTKRVVAWSVVENSSGICDKCKEAAIKQLAESKKEKSNDNH